MRCKAISWINKKIDPKRIDHMFSPNENVRTEISMEQVMRIELT